MTKELNLTNTSKTALVDDKHYYRCLMYKWYMAGNGAIKLTTKPQHRLANFIMKDYDHMYDHKDLNKLNNTEDNLRISTYIQNGVNKRKIRSGATSKYKGIYWNKLANKWHVQVRVNYVSIHIGYFTDKMEAAKAYDKAAIEYHREFARLNFPPTSEPQTLNHHYHLLR